MGCMCKSGGVHVGGGACAGVGCACRRGCADRCGGVHAGGGAGVGVHAKIWGYICSREVHEQLRECRCGDEGSRGEGHGGKDWEAQTGWKGAGRRKSTTFSCIVYKNKSF